MENKVLPVKLVTSVKDAVKMVLKPRLEKQLTSVVVVSVRIRCVEGYCTVSGVNITVFPDHSIKEKIETICGTARKSAMSAMSESPPRPLGKMLGLDVILKELHGREEHIVSLEQDLSVKYYRRN